jgi:chromate transporter
MNSGKQPHAPTFGEAFGVWLKIGFLSFGGPAGQIALMHRILVEEKRWLTEERFLHALNFCMLLPGPEAQQLATYSGWLLHRTAGGLVAGTLFVLPGAVVMLALSIVYVVYQDAPAMAVLFLGIKAAVVAIVLQALVRIGARVVGNRVLAAVALAAFVAIFFFAAPFPAIVLGAGLIGFAGLRVWPEAFALTGHGGDTGTAAVEEVRAAHTLPSARRAVLVVAVGMAAWFAPLAAALMVANPVYAQEGWFFAKLAVVTFGGAYAVLAYMAQQAVEAYQWLSPAQMVDGLGLAETTPGPLILVVQFVGFLGAHNAAGSLTPIAAGTIGAVLATWVTFVPCFMWIFLGAPYVESLRGNRAAKAALAAITAAVVGVIANLSIWFAVHVVFTRVGSRDVGPLRLIVPDWASLDGAALVLVAAALVLQFRFNTGVVTLLAACAGLSVGLAWIV